MISTLNCSSLLARAHGGRRFADQQVDGATLQGPADGLDPETDPVGVDGGDHLLGPSSSAAKKPDATVLEPKIHDDATAHSAH